MVISKMRDLRSQEGSLRAQASAVGIETDDVMNMLASATPPEIPPLTGDTERDIHAYAVFLFKSNLTLVGASELVGYASKIAELQQQHDNGIGEGRIPAWSWLAEARMDERLLEGMVDFAVADETKVHSPAIICALVEQSGPGRGWQVSESQQRRLLENLGRSSWLPAMRRDSRATIGTFPLLAELELVDDALSQALAKYHEDQKVLGSSRAIEAFGATVEPQDFDEIDATLRSYASGRFVPLGVDIGAVAANQDYPIETRLIAIRVLRHQDLNSLDPAEPMDRIERVQSRRAVKALRTLAESQSQEIASAAKGAIDD